MQSDVGTMQCVGRTRRKAKCHAVPCSNWCRKKLATCNKPKQQKLVAISCTIDRGVARGCGPHRAALAGGGKRTKIVFKNSRENSGCNYVFADFTMLTFVFVSHKIGCLARRRLLRPREGHLPILHPTSYMYVTESCRRDVRCRTRNACCCCCCMECVDV